MKKKNKQTNKQKQKTNKQANKDFQVYEADRFDVEVQDFRNLKQTLEAAREVGFASSRDGHFIFRFVVSNIHGSSCIQSKKCFLTLVFGFYLQKLDISFALQRKSRFALERQVKIQERR